MAKVRAKYNIKVPIDSKLISCLTSNKPASRAANNENNKQPTMEGCLFC